MKFVDICLSLARLCTSSYTPASLTGPVRWSLVWYPQRMKIFHQIMETSCFAFSHISSLFVYWRWVFFLFILQTTGFFPMLSAEFLWLEYDGIWENYAPSFTSGSLSSILVFSPISLWFVLYQLLMLITSFPILVMFYFLNFSVIYFTFLCVVNCRVPVAS